MLTTHPIRWEVRDDSGPVVGTIVRIDSAGEPRYAAHRWYDYQGPDASLIEHAVFSTRGEALVWHTGRQVGESL